MFEIEDSYSQDRKFISQYIASASLSRHPIKITTKSNGKKYGKNMEKKDGRKVTYGSPNFFGRTRNEISDSLACLYQEVKELLLRTHVLGVMLSNVYRHEQINWTSKKCTNITTLINTPYNFLPDLSPKTFVAKSLVFKSGRHKEYTRFFDK